MQKIKNATKKEFNGITFRSVLECKVAQYLTEKNINFEYEKYKYILVEKQEYLGVKYRETTYTPDFLIGNIIIEVKGFPNDVWPLKKKLFIKYIREKMPNYKFYEVSSIKQVESILENEKIIE